MTERHRYRARRFEDRLLSSHRLTLPGLFTYLSDLIDLASEDPQLGEEWAKRGLLYVADLRDWLARLKGGEDE